MRRQLDKLRQAKIDIIDPSKDGKAEAANITNKIRKDALDKLKQYLGKIIVDC